MIYAIALSKGSELSANKTSKIKKSVIYVLQVNNPKE